MEILRFTNIIEYFCMLKQNAICNFIVMLYYFLSCVTKRYTEHTHFSNEIKHEINRFIRRDIITMIRDDIVGNWRCSGIYFRQVEVKWDSTRITEKCEGKQSKVWRRWARTGARVDVSARAVVAVHVGHVFIPQIGQCASRRQIFRYSRLESDTMLYS